MVILLGRWAGISGSLADLAGIEKLPLQVLPSQIGFVSKRSGSVR
jgi:hypothetical protein